MNAKTKLTWLYLSLIIFASLSLFTGLTPSSQTAFMLLMGLIVIFGLPHGALDFHLAKSLDLVTDISSATLFLTMYIVIAAISICLWLLWPLLGLCGFLLISVFHFSQDWRDSLFLIKRIALSCVIILGPAFLYADTLLKIFGYLLVSPKYAAALIDGMRMVCFFALALLLWQAIAGRKNKPLSSQKAEMPLLNIEVLCLITSALLLPPLLHFILYFCFLHSIKHMIDISKQLDITVFKSAILSLPFVILTVMAGGAALSLMPSGIIEQDMARLIFIGLFGLTVSHMMLVNRWHHAINKR